MTVPLAEDKTVRADGDGEFRTSMTLDEEGTAIITARGERSRRSASVRVRVEGREQGGGGGDSGGGCGGGSGDGSGDGSGGGGGGGGGGNGSDWTGLAITGGRITPIALGGAGAITLGILLVGGVVYTRRRFRVNDKS
jgi:hypothetical protein